MGSILKISVGEFLMESKVYPPINWSSSEQKIGILKDREWMKPHVLNMISLAQLIEIDLAQESTWWDSYFATCKDECWLRSNSIFIY